MAVKNPWLPLGLLNQLIYLQSPYPSRIPPPTIRSLQESQKKTRFSASNPKLFDLMSQMMLYLAQSRGVMRLLNWSHSTTLKVLYTILGLLEILQSSSSENCLYLARRVWVRVFLKNPRSMRIFKTKHREPSMFGLSFKIQSTFSSNRVLTNFRERRGWASCFFEGCLWIIIQTMFKQAITIFHEGSDLFAYL